MASDSARSSDLPLPVAADRWIVVGGLLSECRFLRGRRSGRFCAVVDDSYGVAATLKGTDQPQPVVIDPDRTLQGLDGPAADFCLAVSSKSPITYDGGWRSPGRFESDRGSRIGESSSAVSCPSRDLCVVPAADGTVRIGRR